MKTKTIFLKTLFILIFIGNSLVAQDKYEFMSINYETQYKRICISIDGKEFLKEDVELPKKEEWFLNTNPILAKVKEYQDKGWEVISLNTASVTPSNSGLTYYTHTAYLRKKKV